MVDPTLTMSIDRTSLSLSPLVFSGVHGTTHGLVDLALPSKLARTEYATSARFLHGSLAVASTWDHTGIGATIELKFTDASSLEAAQAAVEAALGQFSYTVTTTKNGQAKAWKADRGSLVPSGLTFEGLSHTTESFNLTIPVHPVPIS